MVVAAPTRLRFTLDKLAIAAARPLSLPEEAFSRAILKAGYSKDDFRVPLNLKRARTSPEEIGSDQRTTAVKVPSSLPRNTLMESRGPPLRVRLSPLIDDSSRILQGQARPIGSLPVKKSLSFQ